ncbi:hypothetical protein ES707_00016 [subsurface metagenome]
MYDGNDRPGNAGPGFDGLISSLCAKKRLGKPGEIPDYLGILPAFFVRSLEGNEVNHFLARLGVAVLGSAMRDVVTEFYVGVLRRLILANAISVSDSVLVVCGGELDRRATAEVGFSNVTITGLDVGNGGAIRQDAENLTYPDNSFDVVIVHAGLHHCHSPHRALLEMYRVAKKCCIAYEARDSLLMRTAVRLGLTMDYETVAISPDGKSGGVANTGVPNFIYRWTEREVRKTIASYDPSRLLNVRFFYELRVPVQRYAKSGTWLLRSIGYAIDPLSRLISRLAPGQCNEFAFAILKGDKVHPWIRQSSRSP